MLNVNNTWNLGFSYNLLGQVQCTLCPKQAYVKKKQKQPPVRNNVPILDSAFQFQVLVMGKGLLKPIGIVDKPLNG